MEIGIFALGSKGTMGHFNGAYILAQEFLKRDKNNKVSIISEGNCADLVLNKKIKFINVAEIVTFKRVGIMLVGDYAEHFEKIFKNKKFNLVIFETFFPQGISGIKSIDNAEKVLLFKTDMRNKLEYLIGQSGEKIFDKIIVLDDVNDENKKLVKVANKCLKKNKFYSFEPLIKALDSSKLENVIKKYSISDNNYNVLVTMGGGAHRDKSRNGSTESEFFVKIINEINCLLKDEIRNMKFIILSGHFSIDHLSTDSIIFEKHENYFMELLSVVDLVISQGGVNTVNEIRSIGVPAIFIPADRETQILRTKKMTMISESKCLINPTPKALAQQVINFHERYLKDVNKFQKSRKNKLQCSSAKIIDFLLKK